MASLTRRTTLKTTALAVTSVAMPFERRVHVAAKRSMGFRDHWVMGHADDIKPVDRLVKTLVERNGKVRNDAEFLGIRNGHWAAFVIEGFTRM